MNDINTFKIQLIATQALHDMYGFCPATEQVKLLESDGEGTYILFRVGEHEYRCEDGKITNLDEEKEIEKEVGFWRDLYLETQKKYERAEFRENKEKYLKRINEQRFEIHRMKDRIRKLEPIVTELLGIVKED